MSSSHVVLSFFGWTHQNSWFMSRRWGVVYRLDTVLVVLRMVSVGSQRVYVTSHLLISRVVATWGVDGVSVFRFWPVQPILALDHMMVP